MHFALITAGLMASMVALTASTPNVSPNHSGALDFTTNTCGKQNGGKSCDAKSAGGGPCCSEFGFCGQGPSYCGMGCQQAFGTCDPPPSTQKEERCGMGQGSHTCSDNRCCSAQGYCGVGSSYCSVPNNCQRKFGRCDSDLTPVGPSTQHDVRNKPGKVPYGSVISQCTVPRTVALTFDDGPSASTMSLLAILNEHKANATFFVSGVNNGKGPIDSVDQWTHAVVSMAENGHQIASHGWSHEDLDAVSKDERLEEMVKNERALANIVGKYPTYMRPPYNRCSRDTGCLAQMGELGYRVVGFSVDSTDWQHPTDLRAMTEAINQAFDAQPANGSMLLVQHDTIPTSALLLTKHILTRANHKGWKAVTLADCLGEPPAEAYRYPDHFTLPSGDCAVVDKDTCLTVKSFKNKKECFKSLQGCLLQLQQNNVQDRNAKEVCDALTLFCAQCDTSKSDRKCMTKGFHFARHAEA